MFLMAEKFLSQLAELICVVDANSNIFYKLENMFLFFNDINIDGDF